MTAAEFLALPEAMLPTELIDGEVIRRSSHTIDHQETLSDLIVLLSKVAISGNIYIGLLDVYLDEANIVQPDVFWVAPESTCKSVGRKYLRGGPDLVVEVFSPGTARRDKREKFRLYEKHGVREYWMVDRSEQLIEVWVREDNKFVRLDIYGPDEQFPSLLLGPVDTNAIFPPPNSQALPA